MQEDPFEHLDFGEEIKPIHWQQMGIKLTTTTMEAVLLPDGNLILKRGRKLFGVERGNVEALTRFLNQYAQVEPLQPPDESMFKDFKPNPVKPDQGDDHEHTE